jgi:hypothetical protein
MSTTVAESQSGNTRPVRVKIIEQLGKAFCNSRTPASVTCVFVR